MFKSSKVLSLSPFRRMSMKKMKWLFLLIPLIMVSMQASAYAIGDKLTISGFTYQVTSCTSPTYTVSLIGCTNTGDVTIPSEVFDGKDITFTITSIGNGGDNVTWNGPTILTIPSSVTKINGYAFYGCSTLSTINIPAEVTTILPNAFVGLNALSAISVNTSNPNYESDGNGILFTKNKTGMICYPSAKTATTYSIPSGVTKIWPSTFFNVASLTELTVPSSVNDMEAGVYNGIIFRCTNLQKINVDANNSTYCDVEGVVYDKDKTRLVIYPCGKTGSSYTIVDGVTTISSYAFQLANNITSVNLNNVTTLKNRSFVNCQNLASISIPSCLTDIPEGAFESCTSIQNYTVDANNNNYKDINGVLFSKDGTILQQYPIGRSGDYTIPDGVVTIAGKAFNSAKITNLTIPASVTTMGDMSIKGCSSLKSVSFAESSSLTSIGEQTFYNCTSLESITLPKSLTTLGAGAFQKCNKLKSVTVPDGSELTTISKNAFIGCSALEDFTFSGSCILQQIGEWAFSGDPLLKSFAFPASVTTIGSSAFNGCSGLTSVTFPTDAVITTIGSSAFADCGLTSITIPSKVQTIAKEAFKNCDKLTDVTIPAATTAISPEAFKYCTSLKTFKVDKDNTVYSSIYGMLCSKDKNTLMIFPPGHAGADFTLLPPSLTAIGDYAFYDCKNLTNIIIPKKVTSIGKRAFGLDTNLKSIAFLCDVMIDPASINQNLNDMSIDDGQQATSMYGNITIYVRKNLYDTYNATNYYKKFKGIEQSMIVNHNGTDETQGKDEYMQMSGTAAEFLNTTSSVNTFVVPGTVTNTETGSSVTRNVSLIGDYAFEGSNVKEVVLKGDIDYIGAMAFITSTDKTVSGSTETVTPKSTTIKNIFFCGNATPSADQLATVDWELDKNYDEFATGATGSLLEAQNIYVKKGSEESICNNYKDAWTQYKDKISYKIPDLSISHEYISFAREFDVDLSDYKDSHPVYAFTAEEGATFIDGSGDYGTSTKHIRMQSIDVDGHQTGTYIPAGTGVLLKVYSSTEDKTPTDFYYRIGESDINTERTNIMLPVIVDPTTVNGSSYNYYFMNQDKGLFVKLSATNTAFKVPVHKAYIRMAAGSLAKLCFDFPDNSTTGINEVEKTSDMPADDCYYNLNGMKVTNPQKGLYIKNGKKVVIK